MDPTPVADDEALYRAIRADRDEYSLDEDGRVKVAARAFNDRNQAPSVDRSSLRSNPADTKFTATDAIVQVMAHEARLIGNIRVEPDKKDSARVYTVDVLHRPILASMGAVRENLAHCQVECTPTIKPTHFNKRLREALAALATRHGFVVAPSEPVA